MRPLTLITHNDLDGYGVSTILMVERIDARILHIADYDDVSPAVMKECDRLDQADLAETLIIADLRISPSAAHCVRRFIEINDQRPEESRHQLVILDHHAESAESLRPYQARSRSDLEIVIDTSHCATTLMVERMARELKSTGATSANFLDLQRLAALIESVDLWKTKDERFEHGCALNDAFSDNVAGYVPYGHSQHDRFVSQLLFRLTLAAYDGKSPQQIEISVAATRSGILDLMLNAAHKGQRSRRRLANFVATDTNLTHDVSTEYGRMRIVYGIDPNVFQEISETLLDEDSIGIVTLIGTTGEIELRSRNGEAGRIAKLFHGGGHPNAAGGALFGRRKVGRSEAIAQFCRTLNITPDSVASLEIVLSENAISHDILEEGMPIYMRGITKERRIVDVVLMPCGRTNDESFQMLNDLVEDSKIHLEGRWKKISLKTTATLRDLEFEATAFTILPSEGRR